MDKPVSRTMAKATVGIGMKATNGKVYWRTVWGHPDGLELLA